MPANLSVKNLPQCYRESADMSQIAEALTSGADDFFNAWLDLLETYDRDRLNPATCYPEWLDFLARWGGWGEIWDTTWAIEQKRQLLININFIWENRGNKKILPFLFNIFNLDAKLIPESGFILGVSVLNTQLGSDPFSWKIEVNPQYVANTKERSLIEKLAKDFLPCWCKLAIVSRV